MTTAFPFNGSRLLLLLAVALLAVVALSIPIKQPGPILVSAFRFTQHHPHHRYQHRPRRSLSTPIPAIPASSSSSWCATTQEDNEDDWVTIKRKKEQEQQTWEAKIKAKNERKAAGKTQNGRNNNRPPPPPSTAAVKDTTTTKNNTEKNNNEDADTTTCAHYVSTEAVTFAEAYAAELIALSGPQFDDPRTTLGVGGLDDVIAEIKRRVWVPLAAPPSVMHELGITPVRGMILCKFLNCEYE